MILLTSSSPITQITNKVIPDMYTASVLLVLIGLIVGILIKRYPDKKAVLLSLNAAVIALMLFTLILGLPATLMFDLNKVLIAGLCIAGAALVNIILTLYIGFSKDRKRE